MSGATLSTSMTNTDKAIIAAVALVALVAGTLYFLHHTSKRRARRSGRIERHVQAALTDPTYAPYGADGENRSRRPGEMAGPLPAVGQVDDTDYVKRFAAHQTCELYPCPHHPPQPFGGWPPHCRCGNAWPCPDSGLLNSGEYRAEPYNRQDDPGRGWY